MLTDDPSTPGNGVPLQESRSSDQAHPKDPLHGVTLEMMLRRLVDYLGWEEMGFRVPIRCFTHNPSLTSSLKFLRKTPWARKKVEELYLRYDYPE